jgi:hypothetical protein
MKHPPQATLALLAGGDAGGDLGMFARWSASRHVAQCETCRDELAGFEAARQISADLSETPELQWNRLAAEMKANIRLGLAAGECVRASDPPLHSTPLFTRARAAVAFASIIALCATSFILERPAPVFAEEGTVVQATSDGIQIRKGGISFRLRNLDANPEFVLYSSDARGAVGARSVDPKTDYVTINRVHAD